MKLIRRAGILLPITMVALAALIYGMGYLLPYRTQVERATYIDVDSEVIYGLMSDLRRFEQWTPWRDCDPNTKYRVDQPGRGLGATLHWQSQDSILGAGRLVIIDAHPHNKLRMLLEFDGGERAVLAWRFEPLEGGTHIDWMLDAEHGEDPVRRYRGLLMARRLKAAFEPGLDRLRRLSERQPALPTTNVVTEEIDYQVGNQSFTGYVAYDQSRRSRPGVLVVDEGRKPGEALRQRAEQLAELGYVALVLDIAAVLPPAEEEGQPAGVAKAAFEAAKPHFAAALDVLKQQPSTASDKLAAIGYGFGGDIVLNMARAGVELDGAVSFYGGLSPLKEQAERGQVQASLLILNGADDPTVPPEQRQAFIEEMDAAGVDYEFINYPGAKHAFTNPEADKYAEQFDLPVGYNKAADEQSWRKMRDFFARIFR